ncbi:hypothetical protein K488DRAFT_88098 [Vararia minispora EC-137]|uniref:Uncharacterized protein n=1 Tax=Vararia minispora EC-137 TaxID=1314806 RepID=A0ACB8QES1_9AGAM|nr:hypothetical protein K488DRAFT_88098 [Vararia minispora EC-137]
MHSSQVANTASVAPTIPTSTAPTSIARVSGSGQHTTSDVLRSRLADRLSSRAGITSSRSTPAPHCASRLNDESSSDGEEPSDPAAALEYLRAKNASYRLQRNRAREQRDLAETHAVIARGAIEDLTQQVNTKTSKKRRSVRVKSGLVSSEHGKEIACGQAEERAAKEAQAKQAEINNAIATAEKVARRSCGTVNFDFSLLPILSKQKKAELEDTAWALNLSEDGNTKEIKLRIQDYFIANPHLRTQPRYAPLFTSSRARPESSHFTTPFTLSCIPAIDTSTPSFGGHQYTSSASYLSLYQPSSPLS